MFHDAPLRPVTTVRCRRPRKTRVAIRSQYKLDDVALFILTGGSLACSTTTTHTTSESPFLRVALQFPDELLDDAVAVVEALKEILLSDPRCVGGVYGVTPLCPVSEECSYGSSDKRIRLFVLADNTFGSCCPDEITAQHYNSSCLVHFGEACMSRSTRIPVFYVQHAFHFNVITNHMVQQQDGEECQHDLSVQLILGAVKLLKKCLTKCVCPFVSARDPLISVNLVVVGCYPSRDMVEDASRRWRELHPETAMTADVTCVRDGPSVTWCNYELVQLAANVDHPSASIAEADGHVTRADHSNMLGEECCSWVINGVRFPRAREKELQYFLFIGPSGAAQPLHILNVHQHNLFHYPQELRELFFEGNDSLPALIIMDELYGLHEEGNSLSSLLGAMDCGEDDGVALDAAHTAGFASYSVCSVRTISKNFGQLHNDRYTKLQATVNKRARQRAFNIEVIRGSTAIGIVVASLSIAGYYETTMLLHKLLRAHHKRSYIIYIGHLNEFKIANFADTVDCFVAVACPNSREGYFPEKDDGFPKPVVSPVEVLLALRAEDVDSPLYGHPAVFSTTFDPILSLLRIEVEAATGSMGPKKEQPRGDCMALIRTTAGTVMAPDAAGGALARLYQRAFVGLEPQTGQTPVQTQIEDGRHGIARGYTVERERQSSK